MIPALTLTIRNSTDPEIPDGAYPLTFREGGLCGQGQYTAPAVPVWFDVSDGGLCLPYHLEPECRSYPLAELPQSGHAKAAGGAFDWEIEAK